MLIIQGVVWAVLILVFGLGRLPGESRPVSGCLALMMLVTLCGLGLAIDHLVIGFR